MRNKNILPNEAQWNDFWGKDDGEQLKKESWSKKRIKNKIDKYILKGSKILDAGCGSGFFSRYFCDNGAITFSLDYSLEALGLCERVTNKRSNLLNKDLLSNDVSRAIPERFDLIFSDGLFEHFFPEDQDKIMRNMKELLSSNGLIVTFVPNRFSPWELIRPFYMPGIKERPFILNGLVDLNLRNGLSVIEKGGINTLPFSFSSDKIFGPLFGMLLFTVSKKQ